METTGGITGKGFVKGQSGNPGGRPKKFSAFIREQTNDGQTLAEFYLQTFNDKKNPWARRAEAATWLADRGIGKPVMAVEHAGEGGGPLQIEYVNNWRAD